MLIYGLVCWFQFYKRFYRLDF